MKTPKNLILSALALLMIAVTGPFLALRAQDQKPHKASNEAQVLTFVKDHCLACHNAQDRLGELDLSAFKSKAQVVAKAGLWLRVLERVEAGDMPPEDSQRPNKAHSQAFLKGLRLWLREAHKGHAQDPGRVTVRRLNRAEYNYSIEDLLGLDHKPAKDFPDDDVGYGFDTVGDVLSIPPLLLERYFEAAETIARKAVRDHRRLKIRWQAEELPRTGRGNARDGWAWLSTNGQFTARPLIQWPGQYHLRVRAFAQQAGRAKARMALRHNGDRRAYKTVAAERSQPKTYTFTLTLTRGRHELGAEFTNDYWNPKAKNRKDRDRNLAIDWLELEGPIKPTRDSLLERQILSHGPWPEDRKDADQRAQVVLRWLTRRAFRRPITDSEFKQVYGFYRRTRDGQESFAKGLQNALTYILVSPHFLFRPELDEQPNNDKAVRPLNDHELATRLSYGLWCSLPDKQLSDLADSGQLRNQLTQQIRRMLDDPRSTRFMEQFTGQWLQLRRLQIASPDPDLFPSFNEELRQSMRIETEKFFETIVRENRSALDLINARFTFVNSTLAKHYGLRPIKDSRWHRVRAPKHRGGLLGHASILTLTSNPTRTSPVKRGKWLLEALLDDPPPPPLPGTDSLSPKSEKKDGRLLSVRERFELHRQDKACAVCHDRLDPLGFALERFDGLGAWRPKLRNKAIDVSGRLPNGDRFVGLTGLQNVLNKKSKNIVRGLLRQCLVYFLGRGSMASDRLLIDAIVERHAPHYRLRDLLVDLLKSDVVTKRRGQAAGPKKAEKNTKKKGQ